MDNVVVLDKKCYWLIVIPVPADQTGFCFHALVWVKGKDFHLSHQFASSVEKAELWASGFMKCSEGVPYQKR